MIVQPVWKEKNQANCDGPYVWYPERVNSNAGRISMEPRDVYMHNDLDKGLLQQSSPTNELKSACHKSNTSVELLQRYKQSTEPSERAYHSVETIEEALNPSWARHYEIKREPALPNLPFTSIEMPIHEEPPLRLKSAPVTRSPPATSILIIPEPRFLIPVMPITKSNSTPPSSHPRTRALSAKAHISTTVSSDSKEQRREPQSVHALRQKNGTKLSDEEIQQIFKRVYGDKIELQKTQKQQQQPVQIIYTQPQALSNSSSPIYVYQKSTTYCPDSVSIVSDSKSVEIKDSLLNPHHIYRPSLIAVKNIEKKSVAREGSASRSVSRSYRRCHHNQDKQNEPLRAVTVSPHKSKLTLEIDGVKLTHDPKLTLEDKSSNVSKYFIDGRLYLIKEHSYNVIDNIDRTELEKYNRSLTLPSHSKTYQAIPMEKFQLLPSLSELRNNASAVHISGTSSKHVHRSAFDPNPVSENVNINKMSLTKRLPTAGVNA